MYKDSGKIKADLLTADHALSLCALKMSTIFSSGIHPKQRVSGCPFQLRNFFLLQATQKETPNLLSEHRFPFRNLKSTILTGSFGWGLSNLLWWVYS